MIQLDIFVKKRPSPLSLQPLNLSYMFVAKHVLHTNVERPHVSQNWKKNKKTVV